jgi:hypothetical protein
LAEVVCVAFVVVDDGNCRGSNKYRFGATGLIFGRDLVNVVSERKDLIFRNGPFQQSETLRRVLASSLMEKPS